MMDALPAELALSIAAYLNPADRWRLSATSRHYRHLLPVWLRVKIHSPSSHSTLQSGFYVSPASAPQQPLMHRPCMDGDEGISGGDRLQYGTEYIFWTYDYERENLVFLGRHGQKLLYHEDPHYLYTLGLRPMEPDQTWKIIPHKGVNRSISDGKEGYSIFEGEPVPYGCAVCLTVGGQHSKPFRPDSSTRLYLSAHSLSSGALWYSIHNKEWCIDEEFQLFPSADYPFVKMNATFNSSLKVSSESSTVVTTSPPGDDSEEVIVSDGVITERELVVHAIPDIMDGGYTLYSPQSLQHGDAACMLHHVTIPCNFWIQDGIMIFHAFQSLSFKFGVPILEEDQVDRSAWLTEPLAILLRKNSSRWWAIKHYISTAADANEGRKIKMDVFLRNSKDHEDHTIMYDKENEFVHIAVQDAVVDAKFPNAPRQESAVWKFLLCG